MYGSAKSLPMRGVWIEIAVYVYIFALRVSLPMRGVWIEMQMGPTEKALEQVTPHAGSVD